LRDGGDDPLGIGKVGRVRRAGTLPLTAEGKQLAEELSFVAQRKSRHRVGLLHRERDCAPVGCARLRAPGGLSEVPDFAGLLAAANGGELQTHSGRVASGNQSPQPYSCRSSGRVQSPLQ
jgi:hypothetical protein